MKRLLFRVLCWGAAAVVVLQGSAGSAESAGAGAVVQLEKPKALPLALDDAFGFGKVKTFLHNRELEIATQNPMIRFERRRLDFGAINSDEVRQREGHYFTFFWKAGRAADVTVRLEYRQERLGTYVQAKEIRYGAAKGAMKTEFSVVGDEYHQDGQVTAWRAVVIEGGRVVALNQSFLWN